MKAFPRPITKPNTQSITQVPYNSSQLAKRISFNEMQLRKAKGLCFNCDEKFSPSHKCQNRRLLVLQWDEEPPDFAEKESVEYLVELEFETTSTEEKISPKSSLNAMNSVVTSGTIRFIGIIKVPFPNR